MKKTKIKEIGQVLANYTELPGVIHEIASGRIDAKTGVASGDPDDVDNFLYFLIDVTINSSETIDDWIRQKSTANEVTELLTDQLEDLEAFQNEIEVTNKELQKNVVQIIKLVSDAIEYITANQVFTKAPEKAFYVYTHSNPMTKKVFYVGKGTGDRAWDTDREKEWHTHVSEIGNIYTVDIVSNNLTEAEALKQEETLILELEDHLVNKEKPAGLSIKAPD